MYRRYKAAEARNPELFQPRPMPGEPEPGHRQEAESQDVGIAEETLQMAQALDQMADRLSTFAAHLRDSAAEQMLEQPGHPPAPRTPPGQPEQPQEPEGEVAGQWRPWAQEGGDTWRPWRSWQGSWAWSGEHWWRDPL